MILLDTTVLIDFLRSPTIDLRETMAHENVAITGVTRAEILHGVRNAHDLQRLMRALDSLPEIGINASTWDLLGEHLFRLRTRGVAVPFQDALIASSAIENSLPLWTRDSHFATIQTVLPALKLFEEPA